MYICNGLNIMVVLYHSMCIRIYALLWKNVDGLGWEAFSNKTISYLLVIIGFRFKEPESAANRQRLGMFGLSVLETFGLKDKSQQRHIIILQMSSKRILCNKQRMPICAFPNKISNVILF